MEDTKDFFGTAESLRNDGVAVEPTLSGTAGRAWLCDIARGYEILGTTIGKTADHGACVAQWVVEAPTAHPAWHSYAVVVVHLRPVADRDHLKNPVIYLEGATHELWVFALDPSRGRQELIETGIANKHFLLPINFAAQFIELDDDLARDRIHRTVKEIVDGVLSPDTDFTDDWVRRFGGNMLKETC